MARKALAVCSRTRESSLAPKAETRGAYQTPASGGARLQCLALSSYIVRGEGEDVEGGLCCVLRGAGIVRGGGVKICERLCEVSVC